MQTFPFSIPLWLTVILLVWSIFWKGWALWLSSSNRHRIWFIVLLLINTIGILEILYIFIFSKISKKGGESHA